jgi:hypothetical protein
MRTLKRHRKLWHILKALTAKKMNIGIVQTADESLVLGESLSRKMMERVTDVAETESTIKTVVGINFVIFVV